jgi:hypothetical protein
MLDSFGLSLAVKLKHDVNSGKKYEVVAKVL